VNRVVHVAGKRLFLSNLNKVLYHSAGLTKAGVLDYYREISSVIIPYLKDRPITMKRFPDGVENQYFFEKACPDYRPGWIKTAHIMIKTEPTDMCVVNDLASLIWIQNLASIEMHVPLSKAGSINKPDFMVFDLDPGEPADIIDCARAAFLVKEVLDVMKLNSFLKTSGKKGLHIFVPLNTKGVTYDDTKKFSKAVAVLLSKRNPSIITARMSKEKRKGKVFINWSQNDVSKTMICAYSMRAVPVPNVSTPLEWKEARKFTAEKDKDAFDFSPIEVTDRIRKKDLFKDLLLMKQRLPII